MDTNKFISDYATYLGGGALDEVFGIMARLGAEAQRQEAERRRQMEEKFLSECPFGVGPVAFTKKDIEKYNIDINRPVYHFWSKANGKPLFDDAHFTLSMDYENPTKMLMAIVRAIQNGQRYMVLTTQVVAEFGDWCKAKSKLHFASRRCVVDLQEFKIVYTHPSSISDYIHLYGNVMDAEGKLTYLPDMTAIFTEGKVLTSTAEHIIFSKKKYFTYEENNEVYLVDKMNGTISKIS